MVWPCEILRKAAGGMFRTVIYYILKQEANCLINIILVASLRLNPLMVALATWEIFAGLTLVFTQGYQIRQPGEPITYCGKGDIFGGPNALIIFIVLGAFRIWLLTQTRFGAARAAGCNLSIFAGFANWYADRQVLIAHDSLNIR